MLDDALKLWKPLEAKQGERVEVWLAGYEIYMRKSELIFSPLITWLFYLLVPLAILRSKLIKGIGK